MEPDPRVAAALAYEASTGRLLALGGTAGDGSSLQDFWSWDGTWRQITATPQPIRDYNTVMVYDPVREATIVPPGPDKLTWLWKGGSWTAVSAGVPTLTFQGNQTAVFDTQRKQVVLVGSGANGEAVFTWTWDGSLWREAKSATVPPPRAGSAVAYDEVSNRVLLFGGYYGEGQALQDTWAWDGSSWTELHPPTTPTSGLAYSAYDAVNGNVVLVTVQDGATWTWSGTDWIKVAPTHSPKPRLLARMLFDAALGEIVLFGGKTTPAGPSDSEHLTNEIWAWNGRDWVLLAGHEM